MRNPLENVEQILLDEINKVPEDFRPKPERREQLIRIAKSSLGELVSGTEAYILANTLNKIVGDYFSDVSALTSDELKEILNKVGTL